MPQQPMFPLIAGGIIEDILSVGVKSQRVQGCTVVSAGVGLRNVTLDAPNNGLGPTDIVVNHSPGFGTAKSPGGITTSIGTMSVGGTFTFSIWDQTTVPPVLIDAEVHFTVRRIPAVR